MPLRKFHVSLQTRCRTQLPLLAFVMTEALGSRPAPGTPSAKRWVGTRRAAPQRETCNASVANREICVTANRLSGGRMGASLLAAAEAATALVASQWEPAPSHWEVGDFSQWQLRKSHWEIPLGAFRAASGTFNERLEKRVGARGERLVVGRVAARAARRPSPSPTRRREWEARHYRARATSCGVPSYLLCKETS